MANSVKKTGETFNIIILILLILFSLFIIYQLIKIVFLGSWEPESVIIALLILVIGFIFNITIKLTKLESNFNNLKTRFCSLAKDFKEHLSKDKS